MAMLSLTGLCLLAAFVLTLMAAAKRVELWIGVLLLVIANMIALGFGTR